ncbi:lipopolysaccharide biosynthesis protein [Terrihabitans sp. B22-R8]|uniref:lipopolysaccharide biosynthesis protein n=1 Tax=Terrihabitans sp. B22-R8 TaxID=3425128 RepID=UPI00403CBC94
MRIELARALGPLGRRIDAGLLKAAIATSGMKVVSAALNYAMLIVLARLMSVDGFGLYGMIFSAFTLAAAFLTLGQPVLVLKSIPEYTATDDPARKKGIIFFGIAVIAGASALFLVLLALAHAAGLLPAFLRNNALLIAFGGLTIVYAASDYTCNLLRALGHPYQGLAPRDILWRLLTIAGALALSRSGLVEPFEILLVLGLGLSVLVGWQFWRVWQIVRRTLPDRPRYEPRTWRVSSVWMAIGSMLFVASLTVDTVIVGAFLGAQDAAVYFSAARTAAISSLLLVGLRLIAAPVFAQLHYGARPAELRSRIEMVYGLSAATAALFGLLGYIFAPQIMQMFGADYADGVVPFRILLIGLALANAGGMSSSILESTGGERLNAMILLSTQSVTAIAIAVAASKFGLHGAALAKAAGVAIEAMLLTVCVFTRLPSSSPQRAGAA